MRPSCSVMDLSPVPLNASAGMYVMDVGSVMVVSAVHPANMDVPKTAADGGNVNEASEVQPEKAALPMLVMEVGRLMVVRAVQLAKAESPI